MKVRSHRIKAPNSYLFLLIVSGVLFQVLSCKKDKDADVGQVNQTPLFLLDNTSAVTNIDLSYDVVINRSVSFQNGINNNSPAWKKLQEIPETESYSLQVTVDNGTFYMLQDNITTHSLLSDKMKPEDKIAKMEMLDGTYTAYNSLGNTISSQTDSGDFSQGFLDDIDGQFYNTPIDTNTLAANGAIFVVNGDKVMVLNRISNGDDSNSNLYLDLNTGATLLEQLFADDDPTKLILTASHKYNDVGNRQKSTFLRYDYLKDGDVRYSTEQWDYSNFSLNFY